MLNPSASLNSLFLQDSMFMKCYQSSLGLLRGLLEQMMWMKMALGLHRKCMLSWCSQKHHSPPIHPRAVVQVDHEDHSFWKAKRGKMRACSCSPPALSPGLWEITLFLPVCPSDNSEVQCALSFWPTDERKRFYNLHHMELWV